MRHETNATAPADLFDSDSAMDVFGVPGRLTHRLARVDQRLWYRQRWISEARPISGFGVADAVLRVELRFDDECGNGHNTFAATAEVLGPARRTRSGYYSRPAEPLACGCLHDEIARVFPELAGLIRWHLVSTDGPMHYIANTLYHAGDLDYRGLRAGERRQLRNGRTGLPVWRLVARDENGDQVDQFRLSDMVDSVEPPAVPALRWEPVWIEGEGKARDLAAARVAACWPDAPDEVLMRPREELRALLEARLPGLMAEFRAVMDEIGFAVSPAAFRARVAAAESVTNEQIRALRREAAEAGDFDQVAICDVAIADVASGHTVSAAGRTWTKLAARAECARIIAEAQAQE